MQINELKSKKVAVLGFGEKEGKATADYLLRHGVTPVLFDRRTENEWSEEQRQFVQEKSIKYITGESYLDQLDGFDVIFRNPAVPRLTPKLIEMEKSGAVITSQTKWFFEYCPANTIGVTGTKGKGTTSSLIYEILKADGRSCYLTGNIGKIQPFEFLDALTEKDWVVYELSSFQLQDLHKSPHIGVILMVTSEHLDHHKNQEEYMAAKEAIVKFQTSEDVAIVNADYENSMRIGQLGQGKKMYFSRQQAVSAGSFARDGILYVSVQGTFAEFIKQGDLMLKGDHNLENVCAAICAGISAGCGIQTMQSAIKNFKGLEHRLELVGDKNGISFYNDSFSTTPETAIAAIKSFSKPEIVILGGSSKKSNFSELVTTIKKSHNIKAIIFIGLEGGKIRLLLEQNGALPKRYREGAQNMQQVMGQIKELAEPGDVVLLSPACASFGMFKNYKDRGEQFKKAVNEYMNT